MKQFGVMSELQSQTNKLKDAFQGLVDKIKQKKEIYSDLNQNGSLVESYEQVLYEIKEIDIDSFDYQLPPCSIQTSVYKPFQIPLSNPDFANPMANNNVLQQLLQGMMKNSNQFMGGPIQNAGLEYFNLPQQFPMTP